ncbi:MAG: hypothetical protein JSU71_13240 [Betaproteobacteria bacterium]|nr:MAG: hypothetical protein JSU71_13240 [Betaproteobacteria bacterium]
MTGNFKIDRRNDSSPSFTTSNHHPLMNSMRRCHECGQPLGPREMVCPRCGARQRRERSSPVGAISLRPFLPSWTFSLFSRP